MPISFDRNVLTESFDRNVLTESFDKVFFLDPHFEFGGGGGSFGGRRHSAPHQHACGRGEPEPAALCASDGYYRGVAGRHRELKPDWATNCVMRTS